MFMQGEILGISGEIPAPTPYMICREVCGLWAVQKYDDQVYGELRAGQVQANMKLAADLAPHLSRDLGFVLAQEDEEQFERLKHFMFDMQFCEPEKEVKDLHNYAEKDSETVRERLLDVRSKLNVLTEDQSSMLGQYMSRFAPQFLREVKDGTVPENVSWAEYLAKSAPDEQLLNVLQWHVDTIAKQQHSPELAAIVDQAKGEYVHRVEAGVATGWLSEHALARVGQVKKVKVHIGDIFDTVFIERGGYWVCGSDAVIITQGQGQDDETKLESLRRKLDHGLMHEFNHAVIGTSERNTKSNPLAARWIDEALTEHVRLAMKDGQPGVICPSLRREKTGCYAEERILLQNLLMGGKKLVDAALATRAYSGDATDRAAFVEALDEAWGPGVLDALNDCIKGYEIKYKAEGMSKRKAQCEAMVSAFAELMK